ncbi:hypothetical protein FHR81_003313 [Actinoalloteichus hoggarensis]|uniref:hypothetical protein n=1 Tax=Actinoalloteichus hoggarensis TaxID=1470176 RepID=UPI0012FDBC86|nr:hypothetical protein [Actinoalloteichus hoggarensis]MBB5922261.1 hypothetical protein [Actinoalloteichus hoggarensis]
MSQPGSPGSRGTGPSNGTEEWGRGTGPRNGGREAGGRERRSPEEVVRLVRLLARPAARVRLGKLFG